MKDNPTHWLDVVVRYCSWLYKPLLQEGHRGRNVSKVNYSSMSDIKAVISPGTSSVCYCTVPNKSICKQTGLILKLFIWVSHYEDWLEWRSQYYQQLLFVEAFGNTNNTRVKTMTSISIIYIPLTIT